MTHSSTPRPSSLLRRVSTAQADSCTGGSVYPGFSGSGTTGSATASGSTAVYEAYGSYGAYVS
jgi:hypothetical protein